MATRERALRKQSPTWKRRARRLGSGRGRGCVIGTPRGSPGPAPCMRSWWLRGWWPRAWWPQASHSESSLQAPFAHPRATRLSSPCVLSRFRFQGDPSTPAPGLPTGRPLGHMRKASPTRALPDEVLRTQAGAKNRFSLFKKSPLPHTPEPVQEGPGSRAGRVTEL